GGERILRVLQLLLTEAHGNKLLRVDVENSRPESRPTLIRQNEVIGIGALGVGVTGYEEHRAFELFIAQRGAELLQDWQSLGVISAESKLKNTSRSIAGRSFSSTTWVISCRSSTVICLVFAFCKRFTRSVCSFSLAAWLGSNERNFALG